MHPSKMPGIGVVDGETSERNWSILGRKSILVRSMKKNTRAELMEDTLLLKMKETSAVMLKNLRRKHSKLSGYQKKLEEEWLALGLESH
jgi:hypothetical protein